MLHFALQEQAVDNFMVQLFLEHRYNGSYNIAAKPITSLELLYTMIQFLITTIILALQGSVWEVSGMPGEELVDGCNDIWNIFFNFTQSFSQGLVRV